MSRQKNKKSGGKKKGGGAETSLGTLLAKHREQRHWDAYVTLFLRHQGKALKLDEAQKLDAVLHNCLTDALFVRRDMPAVEMTVKIILSSNGESLPLSTETRQCAAVAGAMLNYRQGGHAGPSDEIPCPGTPSYAALRAYVAAPPKADAPRTKECARATALLDKMAKQYAALPEAKSVAYTYWHKNACALAELLPQEPVFGMLARLTGFIRQLKDATHPLRDPAVAGELVRHALTAGTASSDAYVHSGVAALTHIFLCMGQQCYGEHWASAVRSTLCRYLPEKCFGSREEMQMGALSEVSAGATHNKGVDSVLHALLARRALWSDREYFVLGCLCLAAESMNAVSVLPSEKLVPLIVDMLLLLPTVLSRQPVPEILASTVEALAMTQAHIIPPQMISLLHYFSSSALLALMAGNLLRKRACNLEALARQAGMDIPLHLFPGDVEHLSTMFSELPQRILAPLFVALTPESRAMLCDVLLRDTLDDSLLLCEEGASPRDQSWYAMNAERRDFFLVHLEKTSHWRPLLALCGDVPFTLASTRHLSDAFLDFLTRQVQPLMLVRWLCQWKGADLELFKAMYGALEARIFDARQWEQVLEVLDTMPAPLRHDTTDFLLRRWKRSTCSDIVFKSVRKGLKIMNEKDLALF